MKKILITISIFLAGATCFAKPISLMSAGFAAPVVYDVTTISVADPGSIYFDSLAGYFVGNFSLSGTPAWGPLASTGGRIVAEYYLSSNTGALSNAPVNFDTMVVDPTSAVTTGAGWKFTPGVAGDYLVTVSGTMNSGQVDFSTQLNGSLSTQSKYIASANGYTATTSGSTIVTMGATDYLQIIGTAGGSLAGGSDSYAYFTTVSIRKLN